MIHLLKTWPEAFEAVARGDKTHEARKNDRGYSVGDCLCLREWRPSNPEACDWSATSKLAGEYTGRTVTVRVTHITQDCYGLPPDLAIMSIRVVDDSVSRWELGRAEAAERALADADRHHGQTIAQRDYFAEQIDRLAARVGCEEEWSNLHAHACCIDDAIDVLEKRAEVAETGCEIAYKREPTQAEGDAHDGNMGMPGECFVAMGGWTGRRCRACNRWVWGGPTACATCCGPDAGPTLADVAAGHVPVVALHSCQACGRHPDTHYSGADYHGCPMCGLGDEREEGAK